MIFTGALTSFLLGFKQKHPSRNAITIDYNIPYLIVPMLLFGTMVGVSLNKMMPPWIILTTLSIVLIYNSYKTLKKARALQIKENENFKKLVEKKKTVSDLNINLQTKDKKIENQTSHNHGNNILSIKKYIL